MAILFWICVGLLLYAALGYPLLLRVLPAAREVGQQHPPVPPGVSLICAAHNEEAAIGDWVANALALEWPRELLEVIVCCDGCTDATATRARAAGADLVLDLDRAGKVRSQDAGVEESSGELLAFSDANSRWEPGALRELAAAFEDPRVGYAAGQVGFVRSDGGDNEEGLYWRYDMALREAESRTGSITAGNGAIYATRRNAYVVVDPVMGHDLSFPYRMVKAGLRAVYVPAARASEPMVETIGGEFARKRRMMSHAWAIILRGGLLSPRGYGAGYALKMLSHRVLRYFAPLIHLVALAANIALLGDGVVYVVALAVQLAILAAAALATVVPLRVLRIARYYVLTTAAIALGLWDWLRHGTTAEWEPAAAGAPAPSTQDG